VTAPLFLVPEGALDAVEAVTLDGSEGRHAVRVRRITVGERIDVTDGAGVLAECVARAVGRDHLLLDVLRTHSVPAPQPRLVVVQALAKGDRSELAVEMMTEVGVDAITPWSAARCVTQWRGERAARGLARWRSTAREAAKQAHRAWLPEVTEPATTEAVAARLSAATLAIVLDEGAPLALAELGLPMEGEIAVVVGPEGGITQEELVTCTDVGALACRLGDTVLRTSTAGVAALAVLCARTGRWSGEPPGKGSGRPPIA
jgi:16S rRNA (uracil1498-N3)-methyltransferase